MMNDIGLYIHIPFCVQKCNYCAFSSFAGTSLDVKERYVEKLIEEIRFRTRNLKNQSVKWVYVGGGTPNSLPINLLQKVLEALPGGFEGLSVELNPAVIPRSERYDYLCEMKDLGVNRISVGVQSFDDGELNLLGRMHDSNEAKNFLKNVQKAGFQNFNIDLMTGLPNQSVSTVLSNIEIAASFDPTHISAYLLSIDPGTQFEHLYKKGQLKLPSDDEFEEIYFAAVEKLESLGYKQYEVSNFAKPGFECRYNSNTWRNGEYIGCGLSAGNFIDGKRFENSIHLKEYISKPVGTQDRVPLVQEIGNFETKVLLGLRLREGVDYAKDLDVLPKGYKKDFLSRVDKLLKIGFLERKKNGMRIPTNRILMQDNVVKELLV